MDLAQLRGRYQKEEKVGNSLPNNYYRFWNMQEGERATVRFLPDAVDNPMGFMVEKVMHNLDINGERKSIPCLSMYGEDCPICKVSSDFYKQDDKVNGKKFYKNRQHIAQVLVVEDPLPVKDGEESAVGKVRLITINYTINEIIKNAFEEGELEAIPFAYKGGTDFIIKKTMQGEYPSYSLSKFARRPSDLTDEQIEMVEEQLVDLSTLLPKNPGIDKVDQLLEAALSGKRYEPEEASNDDDDDLPVAPKSKPVAESKPAPADIDDDDDDDDDEELEALLASLKERRKD